MYRQAFARACGNFFLPPGETVLIITSEGRRAGESEHPGGRGEPALRSERLP